MLNITIPQTKWTYRVWFYLGWRRTAPLGQGISVEVLDAGIYVCGAHYMRYNALVQS